MSVWPEDIEIELSKNSLEPNDAVGDQFYFFFEPSKVLYQMSQCKIVLKSYLEVNIVFLLFRRNGISKEICFMSWRAPGLRTLIYELLENVPRIFYSTSRIEIVSFSNPDNIRIRLKVTKRCCFRWFLRSPLNYKGTPHLASWANLVYTHARLVIQIFIFIGMSDSVERVGWSVRPQAEA